MSYSQTNTIASEIFSDDPLSEGTLSYLEARAKNTFYDYVMTKFKEAERSGLTRAKLARRLNKKPDQISHLLGAPGNWTLGTIATLLVGISKEEILPHSASFLGRSPRNRRPKDICDEATPDWTPRPGGNTSTPPSVIVPAEWNKPQ